LSYIGSEEYRIGNWKQTRRIKDKKISSDVVLESRDMVSISQQFRG
jgi:hypothetical protein